MKISVSAHKLGAKMAGVLPAILCLFMGLGQISLAQPNADFKADTTWHCKPGLIRFTDLSTGATTWNWDFGNGGTSTLQNPSVVYNQAGTYTVKLTVNGPGGSHSTQKLTYINILELPKADFSYADSFICQGSAIQFNDLSVAQSPGSGISRYLWDFGDGNTSTLANPKHTYQLAGLFTVKLRIWDSRNCEGFREKSQIIRVWAKPNTQITADKRVTCAFPAVINFKATDQTSGNIYHWDFGDGSYDSVANPSHLYTSQGAYNIKLRIRNANGCEDSATWTQFIQVGSNAASFTASPNPVCLGQSVQFHLNGATNAVMFEWNFGDGKTSQDSTPAHLYTTSGEYDVSLVVTYIDGCVDTIHKTAFVRVDEVPNLNYTYRPLINCTAPFNATFINSSAQPDGTTAGMNYSWDFGDGGTSTLRNPIHTYNSLGPHIVKLKVTTAGGCYAERTDTIVFAPEIKITATSKYNCGSSATVNFSYTTNMPGTITAHAWSFGDGGTATLKSPSRFYASEGTFIVSLKLTSSTGCVYTGYDTVFVYEKPKADFEGFPLDTCARKSVRFRNKSTGNTTMFVWDFGDGTPPDTTYPGQTVVNHLYIPVASVELPDSFDVTLIAFNGTCTDTLILPKYVVIQPPYAKIMLMPTLYCGLPATIYPQDVSLYQNPRDSVVRMWFFGDSKAPQCTTDTKRSINVGVNCNCSVDSLPRHTYADTGVYNVKLRVYSKRTQCIDSTTVQVKVRPEFKVGFTANMTRGCAPLTVNFTDTSKNGVKWFWDFGDLGDADTDIVKSPVYTFRRPGRYSVSLWVKAQDGCENVVVYTQYIDVRGPQANFTYTGALCPPYPLSFRDVSTNTTYGVSWRWRFGDGSEDSVQHPVHAYAKAGIYPVTLTVTDSEGCTHSIVKAVNYQPPKPVLDFDRSIVCPGVPVQFINKTPAATLNDYRWDFGDGFSSAAFQPLHSYADTGLYQVKLLARRKSDGCMDSVWSTIPIRVVIPGAAIYTVDTNGLCPPHTVSFSSNTTPDVVSWFWDFGDSSYSQLPNPQHTYNKPGKYTVRLKFISAGGCEDSLERIDLIRVNGPRGELQIGTYSPCAPAQIRFNAVTQDAALYTWDFGDGTVQSTLQDTIWHTYLNGGVFYPTLILTDSNGCTMAYPALDSIVVTAPAVPAFNISTPIICLGDSVLFTDATSGASSLFTRYWDFGDSTQATGLSVYHTYQTPGVYSVSLRIRDTSGCESFTLLPALITVMPEVSIQVSADTSICQGTPVQLLARGGLAYTWEPQTDIPNPNDSIIWVQPKASTNYKVTAYGPAGCPPKVAFIQVNVKPLPAVYAGTDRDICEGDSVFLQASGAESYTWQTLSGQLISLADSFWYHPSQSETLVLQGTGWNDCVNRDTLLLKVVPRPQAVLQGPDVVCAGARVRLQASGAETYRWSNGLQGQAIEVRVLRDTVFKVFGSNRGCEGPADSIRILVKSNVLAADFDWQPDSVFEGQLISTRNLSEGAISFQWLLNGKQVSDSANPMILMAERGLQTLTLLARNEYNCEDAREREIKVYPFLLTFPNAFTPDGNSRNELFRGYAPYPLLDVEFLVFDRWGERIFRTNSWEQGWDGTYKGVPVQEGVYTYVFSARKPDGKPLLVTGTFTLIR